MVNAMNLILNYKKFNILFVHFYSDVNKFLKKQEENGKENEDEATVAEDNGMAVDDANDAAPAKVLNTE